MDFGFNQEQEALRESVHEFLVKETPTSYARSMADDDVGVTDAVWRSIAQLGWLGLTVPEEHGGSGLGNLELVLVMAEMGAVVMPGPFMSTVCLGVPAILAAGNDADKSELLPAVATGERRATVALCESSGSWHPDGVSLSARREGSGFKLEGEKLFVPDARSADDIIVVAALDEGFGLFRVPAGHAGVSLEAMDTVDRTRKLDVVTLDTMLDADNLLGRAPVGREALEALLGVFKTALAAEMAGCARAVLDMSVDYAKIREQFGRPIGSFQAIQHKCADMKVDLENALSLVYYAAWAIDEGQDDALMATAMCKAYASDACSRIVADGVQVHGGIGFTWEHDMQLYFKRVKAGEVTYGDGEENRELVASLLEL